MSIFRGYVGAKNCTGKVQPGVAAFKDAALAAVPESWSDGILNCRSIRGSTKTTSLHGEGRAFDWGCKAGAKWAQQAADYLVSMSKELGIQCVIYNRRIWSGAHPDSGWRAYHGVDAHTTHLHIEFSWAAARGLTEARAAHYLAPLEDDMATPRELWGYQGADGKYPADAWRLIRDAARDSASALEVVKALAAKPSGLTPAEIEAAAERGAKAAIDAEIDSATVQLNVTKEQS